MSKNGNGGNGDQILVGWIPNAQFHTLWDDEMLTRATTLGDGPFNVKRINRRTGRVVLVNKRGKFFSGIPAALLVRVQAKAEETQAVSAASV